MPCALVGTSGVHTTLFPPAQASGLSSREQQQHQETGEWGAPGAFGLWPEDAGDGGVLVKQA